MGDSQHGRLRIMYGIGGRQTLDEVSLDPVQRKGSEELDSSSSSHALDEVYQPCGPDVALHPAGN